MSELIEIGLSDIKKIFKSLRENVGLDLSISLFDCVWAKNLPAADLVSKNKPINTGGHTSHIAITSHSMKMFPISDYKDSSWYRFEIDLIPKLIKYKVREVDVSSSFFSKREAFDTRGKHQIYISKKDYDDDCFYQLREQLNVDDQLWILKYKNQNKFFVFGLSKMMVEKYAIPNRFFYMDSNINKNNLMINNDNLKTRIIDVLKESNFGLNYKSILDYIFKVNVHYQSRISQKVIKLTLNSLVEKGILYSNIVDNNIVYEYRNKNFDEYVTELSKENTNMNSHDNIILPKTDKFIEINSSRVMLKNQKFISNSRIKEAALKLANHECQYGKLIGEIHNTFTSRKHEGSYMEAHHLVRMCDQSDELFVRNNKLVNLDQVKNIVSLCPICHAKIHFGRDEDVKNMIKKLYDFKKSDLSDCGIDISVQQLIDFYIN